MKKLKKPIYIGGGINHKNAKLVIDNVHPNGLDVSRSLKDKYNNSGYLVYKSNVYVFQPINNTNEDINIYERQNNLSINPSHITIDYSLIDSNNIDIKKEIGRNY